MLEKEGMYQVAHILEEYGIDSKTDVSDLQQDDFSPLESRGFKTLHVKYTSSDCCDKEEVSDMICL